MQPTSQSYKESMKSNLRGRGYMRVVFGFLNTELQNNATISGDQTAVSDPSKVFNNGLDDFVYANLERNFTKLDGSRCFGENDYYNKEYVFVGNTLIDDNNPYTLTIDLGDEVVSFNQLTINFGDNYPVDFTIGDLTVTDNDQKIFFTNHSFDDVTSLTLTVTKMINESNRLRIYSINFGTGIEYNNDMILDSSFQSTMSPINKELPQMNYSVKLVNENHYFDIENPNSLLNKFNTSTECSVYYGYELPDETIEWLKAAKLYCYDWENDEESATIYAKDILQLNDTEYYKGSLSSISLYTLAQNILNQMGISNYYIDPGLQNIYTTNPIPRCTCKEALQIIANMGNKKLLLTRDGGIQIGDSAISYTPTSNGELYNQVLTITTNDYKYIYGNLETNQLLLDNTRYFDSNGNESYLKVGYISSRISDSHCLFVDAQANMDVTDESLQGNSVPLSYTLEENYTGDNINPILTLTLDDETILKGINIKFGALYPVKFDIRLYLDDVLTETLNITNNTSYDGNYYFAQGYGDKIEIEFYETLYEYNRIYVNYVGLLLPFFEYSDIDLMTYPKFSRLETIKEITVPYYIYNLSADEKSLIEVNVNVMDADVYYTFLLDKPCGGYRCTVSEGLVTIIESNLYYITVKFTTTGSKTLIVYGKEYTVSEENITQPINEDGITLKWENPLIDNKYSAENLIYWLKEYYESMGEYEFNTRGNPELDVNDIAKQPNYFVGEIDVLIEELELNFDGAFSGKVKTLRIGG